jgi:DNA repair protein RadC
MFSQNNHVLLDSARHILTHNDIPMIRLAYSSSFDIQKRPKLCKPDEVYKILLACWDRERIELCEQLKVCLLNNALRLIGICDLCTGGATSATVDASFVIALAILANSQHIILAHNHPSGNLKPSPADLELTSRIRKGAALLGISLLDHLIITPAGFHSIGESGELTGIKSTSCTPEVLNTPVQASLWPGLAS